MKMKNMIAAMTAVAVSAFSFAAMTASAAVTEITYTGAGTLATENNGTDIRLNLLNTWGGNNYPDIPSAVNCEDNVTVTFTISGLGTNSSNTNEDGSAGAPYIAWLSGSIGAEACWDSTSAAYAPVSITGDGQYSVTWNLESAADTINCLILSTNINFYNYAESLDASGLSITIDKITTGVEDAPAETQAPETQAPAADTTAAPGTTAAGGTTAAATTTATTGSTTTTNANTSDTTGIAVALAGLTAAGALALVSRKRK